MKKITVDVEANLLHKRSKLREKEKSRTENKRMTPSEVKLDILANIVKEMMQKISNRGDIFVQGPDVPLMLEREKINVPKHLAS